MTTIRGVTVLLMLLGLPLGAAAQLACGSVVSKGDRATLTADLGPCDGVDAAIVVGGGSLDLGGHTVRCADANLDGDLPQGVVLFGKKSKLMNGTIVGCSNGVGLGGDGKHLVKGVTSRGSADDGFDAIPGADKCKLMDNTSVDNADDGIQIRSDKNKLVGNNSMQNGDDGYDLWASAEKNKLVNARAEGNADEGILIDGSKNNIVNATASGNGTVGIDLDGDKNKVRAGVAQGNGVYDV